MVEPDLAVALPRAEDAAPVYDPDSSTVDAMSRPFRDGDDRTAEEAVEKAIETVVLERLKALFPSTMKQQTSVMALMIANEVFTWACTGAGDCETQCTPDSTARSGYRKLPVLHSSKSSTCKTAAK